MKKGNVIKGGHAIPLDKKEIQRTGDTRKSDEEFFSTGLPITIEPKPSSL